MPATSNLLSTETILALAERSSGAYDLADDALRHGVATLIESINQRGPYAEFHRDAMSRQILTLLTNRLRLALDGRQYPGIADERRRLGRPIFPGAEEGDPISQQEPRMNRFPAERPGFRRGNTGRSYQCACCVS